MCRASFKVVRHVRPKLSCRVCETIVQAPMPFLPIERGKPGPGLLAHVLVTKYADHLPLYRQQEIYAREGIDLERSTLADWVGRTAALLEPLIEALRKDVLASDVLHGDDTPVPVLAPGLARPGRAGLWAYVRDGRPHGSTTAASRRVLLLSRPEGRASAGGTSRTSRAFCMPMAMPASMPSSRRGEVTEAACWAHVRRKFFDVHAPSASPLANEALDRIGALYGVEDTIRGKPPDERRRWRQNNQPRSCSRPEGMDRGNPAKAVGQDRARQGHALCPVALGRAQPLPRRWPHRDRQQRRRTRHPRHRPGPQELALCRIRRRRQTPPPSSTLIETCKLNGIDPEAYLRSIITRIADHPIQKIADLLPWNWAAILALTAWFIGKFTDNFHIAGFWDAFWGAVIISLVSFFMTRFINPRDIARNMARR